eukprot:1137340-Pelagomonas_calceolata.AAC.2
MAAKAGVSMLRSAWARHTYGLHKLEKASSREKKASHTRKGYMLCEHDAALEQQEEEASLWERKASHIQAEANNYVSILQEPRGFG